MLPNWLYGKSKSKLASILGGGGGTPADYDQVKAQVTQNTEDILSLSDALDAKAALTQISNPNILINPWFTVNQRGFTTASSASNTYVADRWKVVSASGITITNGEAGITIDNTNGSTNATMETLLAPNVSKSLLGREVTMSLSTAIGVTHLYKTFTMPDSLPQSSTVISNVTAEDCTLRTVITGSGYVKVDVQVKEGKSITIRAIKLEIGSISTLARDPRPNYATELAKCQRYFYKLKTLAPHITYFQSATEARTLVTTPVPMRTTPTIVLPDNPDFNQCQIYTADGMITPSAITISSNAYYNAGITNELVLVSTVTGATINTNGVQRFNININFNAEL